MEELLFWRRWIEDSFPKLVVENLSIFLGGGFDHEKWAVAVIQIHLATLRLRYDSSKDKSHNKPTWILQKHVVSLMSWRSFFWGCWKGKTSSQWWINRWDRQGGAQKQSSWTTQCLEDDPFPTPRIFSNLYWCKTKEVWQKRTIIEPKTPNVHIT